MAATDDVKSFWDAVAKGIEQARDPVAAALKAIADGEKDKERLIKEGVKAAIKAHQDAEKEQEKILNDAYKEQEKLRKQAADKAKKDAEDEAKRKAELNAKVFEGLTTAANKVGAVLTNAMNAVTNFGNSIAAFVGKANPAAVMRFRIAVDDMTAVIGRVLTPVLERVTIVVRGMGDAVASLSGPAQSFIAGMSGGAGIGAVLAAAAGAAKLLLATLGPIPIIVGLVGGAIAGVAGTMASGRQVAEAFGRVAKVVGTIIESLAAVVLPLVSAALEVVVPLLEMLADAITYVTDTILSALESIGLAERSSYDPTAKSSVGAAVRQASIGDISSFASKAYSTAYGGASNDVPKAQLSEMQKMNKTLEDIKKGLMADGTRKEDRQVMGSSSLGRAVNPFEKGTDGKTNFRRGLDVIKESIGRNDVIAAMADLF